MAAINNTRGHSYKSYCLVPIELTCSGIFSLNESSLYGTSCPLKQLTSPALVGSKGFLGVEDLSKYVMDFPLAHRGVYSCILLSLFKMNTFIFLQLCAVRCRIEVPASAMPWHFVTLH
jgi:hypothetical protein